MSYPVLAYRNGQRLGGTGGFQNLEIPSPRPGLPSPANDNVPFTREPYRIPRQAPGEIPLPANDNVRVTRGGGLTRGVLRRVPWLLVAGVAYDLYRAAEAKRLAPVWTYGPGWELYVECGGITTHTSIDAITGCAAFDIVADSSMTGWHAPSNWVTEWLFLASYNPNPAFSYYQHTRTWHWTLYPDFPSSSQPPALQPGRVVRVFPGPLELPDTYPELDPMSNPIGQPQVNPRPIPWRVLPGRQPNPWRSPSEQSSWGYTIGTVEELNGQPLPSLVVQPGLPVLPNGPPHVPEPPGPGVHERKNRTSSRFGGLVFWAVNIVTESMDVVDALYDALPFKYQVKTYRLYGQYGTGYGVKKLSKWAEATPEQKLWALYKYYKYIDVNKALLNLVTNQLLDHFGGLAGKGAKRLAVENGDPVSILAGPAL